MKQKRCLQAILAISISFLSLNSEGKAQNLIKSYETENAVYQLCKQGSDLINRGDYAQAEAILSRATGYDPTSYSQNVHLELSAAARGKKDFSRAVAEIETAQRFKPYDQGLYDIAMIYYEAKDYDRASDYLSRYLAMGDVPLAREAKKQLKEVTVYGSLSKATKLIDQGKFEEAKKSLNKAAAFDPSNFSGDVHGNLAYLMQRTGRPEEAIVEGKKALGFDPKEKTTLYTIGLAYQDIGSFDEAISYFKRYCDLETNAQERQQALNFIQELADDKVKLDPAANSSPDYLDQIRASGDGKIWRASTLPLKVYIAPCKDKGYKPVFRDYIANAFDTWCEASGKRLNYTITNRADDADIKVSFTAGSVSMAESGRVRQKAGLTQVFSSGGTKIDSATVVVRTLNSFDMDQPVENGECASTCMHEIGHALGLGHSTMPSDVMYFGSSSKQSGMPTKRDKLTIARMYQSYAPLDFKSKLRPEVKNEIKYLPPPGFVPPKPPATDFPLFLPPPLKRDLAPPLFTPPPLAKVEKSDRAPSAGEGKNPPPLFMPAPIAKTRSALSKKSPAKGAPPPFFHPPVK